MLNQYLIFAPLLAMILLTAIVLLWMYRTRIGEIRKLKINPQQLADHEEGKALLKNVAGPSDNFSNLFESPVIFYVAILTIFSTQTGDNTLLSIAWIYVILRYLHSFIHCSYNKVMHRFKVYLMGTFVLWLMWILIAFKLIEKIS